MKKTVLSSCAALALVTLGLASATADQQFNFGCTLPMQVQCSVSESACDNSPGPWITIEGQIALGGLQAQLIFQNNTKGTHSQTVTYSTNIVLDIGAPISIPKQPVLGGVGGNPWISIQFLDGNNVVLTDEVLLGRCVQGLTLNSDLLAQALAAMTVSAADCSNHPGPVINVGGNLTLGGLKARLILRNNAAGTHTNVQTIDVTLIAAGSGVQIPKQPCLGGVGGNPLIWVQFLQGQTPIGDPIFLGRCNQI